MLGHTAKRQHGLTMSGLIFLLVVIGLVVTVALKLIPIFMENGSVIKSVQQLKNINGIEKQSVAHVQGRLNDLLNLNDVRGIPMNQFKEYFTWKKNEKGVRVMVIKYNREAQFFKNIYLLVKFDSVVEFN